MRMPCSLPIFFTRSCAMMISLDIFCMLYMTAPYSGPDNCGVERWPTGREARVDENGG